MSRSKANLLVHCYSCCLYVDCFVEKILAQSSFFYAVFVAKMPHQYWCLFVTFRSKVKFWKPGRAVAKSKIPGGHVILGGDNVAPPG
jgi:hypothetical protein